MSKKSAPGAPDLGPLIAASERAAETASKISAEQLAWAREQDKLNRDLLNRTLDVQLPIMQEQFRAARSDRARYESIFQPLEENLVREFQGYDSPERRMEERGRAVADVSQSFDAQRRNALSRLESFGVDPSQTRNAALDMSMRVQQAAASAGAANAADQRVENTARALRADAINIGRGLPSQVAQSYGQSVAAGQAGLQGGLATTASGVGALAPALQFGAQGMQGLAQAGNLSSMNFGNQMQSWQGTQNAQNALYSGLGQLAGMGMTFVADGGPLPATKRSRALPMPASRAPQIYDMEDFEDEAYESRPGKIDYGHGDGSGIDDRVPIMASTEEYIIPADVVRKKGVEFFDKLVDKYHVPAAQQRRAAIMRGG